MAKVMSRCLLSRPPAARSRRGVHPQQKPEQGTEAIIVRGRQAGHCDSLRCLARSLQHPRRRDRLTARGRLWPALAGLVGREILRRSQAESRARESDKICAAAQAEATLGRYMVEMRTGINNALTTYSATPSCWRTNPGSPPARKRKPMPFATWRCGSTKSFNGSRRSKRNSASPLASRAQKPPTLPVELLGAPGVLARPRRHRKPKLGRRHARRFSHDTQMRNPTVLRPSCLFPLRSIRTPAQRVAWPAFR